MLAILSLSFPCSELRVSFLSKSVEKGRNGEWVEDENEDDAFDDEQDDLSSQVKDKKEKRTYKNIFLPSKYV